MKYLLTACAILFAQSAPLLADGNAQDGEKAFKKCNSCHMVVAEDGKVIVKGGKTGPNLYGVVGRVAGSFDGFKYGAGLEDAAANGLVWTPDLIAEFVANPKAWLGAQGLAEKTKMTFRLKSGAEDVAAYLATLNTAP